MLESTYIPNYIKTVVNPVLSSATLISQILSDFGAGETIAAPVRKVAQYSRDLLRFTRPLSYLEGCVGTPSADSAGQTIITVDGNPVIIDSSTIEEGAIVEGLLSALIAIAADPVSEFIKGHGKILAAGIKDYNGKVYGAAIQIDGRILLDYMSSFLQSYTAKLVKEDEFSVNKERARFLSNVLLPTINLATTIYNGSLDFRTIAMAATSAYSVANAIRSTYARLPLLKKIEEFKNTVLTSKNEEKIVELSDFINKKMKIDIDKIIKDIKGAEDRIAKTNILKTRIEANLSRCEEGSEEYKKQQECLQQCSSIIDKCQEILDNLHKLKTIVGDKTFDALKNIVEVRKLKEQGKVNYLPEGGRYPIEMALLSGNIDAVKYLIANGANLELESTIVEGIQLKNLCEVIEKVETKLNEASEEEKQSKLVSVIAQYANTENGQIVKEYLGKKFPGSVAEINKEFEDLEKLEKRIAVWEKIDAKSHVDGNKTLMEIAIDSKRLDQVEYLLIKDSRLNDEEKKDLYYDPKNSQVKILQKALKFCRDQDFKKKLDELEASYAPARKRFFFF